MSSHKDLLDASVGNTDSRLPIEGILLTMRLGQKTADEAFTIVGRLLDRIEQDSLCKYLLVLAIDDDERHSDTASMLIQKLQSRVDSGQQLQSLHVLTNPPKSPSEPFAICKSWDAMAVEAWKRGADWVVLLGDDVESFSDISQRLGVPFGFGAPIWNDQSFPGFPTFPCIGRAHYEIFGSLIPKHRQACFINQDLDPYLHQLYVKLGAAPCVTDATLHNNVGGNIGSCDARYERVPSEGWRDFVLDDFRDYIRPSIPEKASEKILLDVVVPSFRVRVDYLQSICYLEVPKYIHTNFIIIIDNKNALLRAAKDIRAQNRDCNDDISVPEAEQVLEHYLGRSGNNVRVRCNEENLGASASRNRGIDESAAEFILNLDDDLIPDHDLLEKYGGKVKEIDESVTGLVGLVRFPRAPDLPLRHAVKCILFRRTHVRFDLAYAKTGGGEDVDYSLRVTEACGGGTLLAVPEARVVHPFWPGGVMSLCAHFHNWAIETTLVALPICFRTQLALRYYLQFILGDGTLFKRFPEHRYWSFPNLAETVLVALPLFVCTQIGLWGYLQFILRCLVGDFLVDFFLGDYNHRVAVVQGMGKDRITTRRSHLFYFLAHTLANFYVVVLECGRLRGHIRRLDLAHGLFRRFDWHIGRLDNATSEFRKREAQKFCIFMANLLHVAVNTHRQD
ncbi:hypothetical protein ACHAWF_016979 [Thalassiosira exigua]